MTAAASAGSAGMRLITAISGTPLWRARARMSHGTWSAYRVTVVTNITRSAASINSTARARLDRSTLSKSGASMITSPRAM